MSTVDTDVLTSYVAKRSDSELVEDLSHLFEVNVVTSAIAATDFGKRYKLPIRVVDNIAKAFKVYSNELIKRSTNSDKFEDTGYTLLAEYYKCIKIIRALSKYLNSVHPELDNDFSNNYTELYEHKSNLHFKKEAMGD